MSMEHSMIAICPLRTNELRKNSTKRDCYLQFTLEFSAIHILKPVQKAGRDNQYIVMITDCFSKIFKEGPISRIPVTDIETILIEYCNDSYRMQDKHLTENEPQLTSKSFAAINTKLGVKVMERTEYPFQADGKVKYFKVRSAPHWNVMW